ncbi:MAG: hypothetical protein V3V19_04440 [Cocleimonas sp.]
MPNKRNIPLITDLVYSGDPLMKAKAELDNSIPSQLDGLNQRIDDIETAIGQGESDPLGRAHAIRSESNTH